MKLPMIGDSLVTVTFKVDLLGKGMSENMRNASASSSSSLSSSFQDTEDDHTIASILAEDGDYRKSDNMLGKRLSHLDSFPHTPRINGEIPDVNDATLDHERLSERLATYGLTELQMEGDGNCQFRALADQLFRNPDHHKYVRRQVTKQLKHNKKLYEGYVPMKYKSYLKQMKKLDIFPTNYRACCNTQTLTYMLSSNRSGEWGDHITLQAAADRFDAKICLVTSFRDNGYIEILPTDKSHTKGKYCFNILFLLFVQKVFLTQLWLSFWSEVHYNSLYTNGDVPCRVTRKKYWLF
ncbi:hypothetical protein Lal_00039540 [Lupinus albus]|nr:hypothetical protein Lal_00039540 [Lupinus albus]